MKFRNHKEQTVQKFTESTYFWDFIKGKDKMGLHLDKK